MTYPSGTDRPLKLYYSFCPLIVIRWLASHLEMLATTFTVMRSVVGLFFLFWPCYLFCIRFLSNGKLESCCFPSFHWIVLRLSFWLLLSWLGWSSLLRISVQTSFPVSNCCRRVVESVKFEYNNNKNFCYINLPYHLYILFLKCHLLWLIRCGYLLKFFLKTLILMNQVPLPLLCLLGLIWNYKVFV